MKRCLTKFWFLGAKNLPVGYQWSRHSCFSESWRTGTRKWNETDAMGLPLQGELSLPPSLCFFFVYPRNDLKYPGANEHGRLYSDGGGSWHRGIRKSRPYKDSPQKEGQRKEKQRHKIARATCRSPETWTAPLICTGGCGQSGLDSGIPSWNSPLSCMIWQL